jgi:hypothetical protein
MEQSGKAKANFFRFSSSEDPSRAGFEHLAETVRTETQREEYSIFLVLNPPDLLIQRLARIANDTDPRATCQNVHNSLYRRGPL